MSERFEIVRTDADQPWHARFVASNGRIVWATENYTRRSSALNAIELIVFAFPHCSFDPAWEYGAGRGPAVVYRRGYDQRLGLLHEIREIDARRQP